LVSGGRFHVKRYKAIAHHPVDAQIQTQLPYEFFRSL